MFKRVLFRVSVGIAFGAASLTAHAADITGAGASFPYPIYAKWAAQYQQETGNRINYQSIGSGGGQQQIIAKTVDFGASDDPMKADSLTENELFQFPAIVGGRSEEPTSELKSLMRTSYPALCLKNKT